MPRHSHISYVEVGPDFIRWSEFQIAGIQDVLQLFNERQLLLLFAGRHSPCTAAPIQRCAPAVCAHRQVTATVRGLASTERHKQLFPTPPSSKIRSVADDCSPRGRRSYLTLLRHWLLRVHCLPKALGLFHWGHAGRGQREGRGGPAV